MNPLSDITALIEKFLLLWRHISAKNGIAMGKAAEAFHDVAMAAGIRRIQQSEMTAQGHAAILIGEIFGMGKRQMEELAEADESIDMTEARAAS